MRDSNERTVGARNPQHNVGEGEVGYELPVAHQKVQPFDVGVTGFALGLDYVAEGRHPIRLAAWRRRPRAPP